MPCRTRSQTASQRVGASTGRPRSTIAPAMPAAILDASTAAPSPTAATAATPLPPTSISFACGGWLMFYHFGVAKALQQFELEKRAHVIGCSAGALAATALALECDFDAIRDFLLENVVPKAHATLAGPFHVRKYLRATLAAAGKLDRFATLDATNAPSQLTIVYSSLSAWASRRVSSFVSQDELEQSLLASCCAPPIAGMPFKLRGEWVMDGGVMDFQPLVDASTLTVSPFYCTAADIKPSRYVPMWWAMFPPGVRDVQWLFELGYSDALAYIHKAGFKGTAQQPAVGLMPPSTAEAGDANKWTTSVGRFLGYRNFENRVLDALFVGLFVCLWKPLVFVLLYLELYVHALIAGSKAAVFGAAAKLMISSFVIAATVVTLATLGLQDTLLFFVGLTLAGLSLGGVVLLCGGLHEASKVAAKDWATCRSCVRNITSLSLFLRSVPVYGASVELKRHEFLLQHSFVYRVTLHFV